MSTTNYGQALDELAQEIYNVAESQGFWEGPYDEESLLTIPAKLALIHAEVSEALEVHRDIYDDAEVDPVVGLTPMQEDDFTEELADIVIRVLDIVGCYDLDLGDALVTKIESNRTRSFRHDKRF